MARKVKTITEETDEILSTAQLVKPTEESEESFEEFAASLPDVNRISVFRLDRKTGRYAFCGALPPETPSPAQVQELFGAGDFMIRFQNASGKYLKSRLLSIEAPPQVRGPESPPGGPAPGLSTHLEIMQSQIARQQELILHLIDKSQTENPKNDLVSVIEAVGSLRALSDPQEHISGIVTALTEGLKLGMKTSNGGGSPDKFSGIMGMVEKFAEVLPRVFPKLAQPAPAAAPAPGPIAGAAQVPGNGSDARHALGPVIQYLKSKAAQGKDPGLWAEWITDNLDEAQWYQVAQLIEQPFEEISKFLGDPELDREPFKSWFTRLLFELRNQLAQSYEESKTDDPINHDSQRAGGNGGSAGPNGPVSEGLGPGSRD